MNLPLCEALDAKLHPSENPTFAFSPDSLGAQTNNHAAYKLQLFSDDFVSLSDFFSLATQNSVFFRMETFFTNIVFSNDKVWRIARHSVFWAAWILFLSWTYSLKMASETTRTIGGINASIVITFVETIVYLPCHLLLEIGRAHV